MNKTKIETSKMQHLLGISIVLAFLLPHSNTFLLLVNPLFCILLCIFSNNRRWNSLVLVPLIPIFLSIILNITTSQQKALLSTSTIILFFCTFPMVGKIRVSKQYLFFILAVILVSQLVYVLDIPFLTRFFDTYYPLSEDDASRLYMRENISYETLFDYRLGGLFHNSNQCSRYLTMLLAFYLVEEENQSIRETFWFSVLAFIGVLITGSRTGFVVASLVLFFALYSKGNLTQRSKLFFIFLAFLGVISLSLGVSFRGLEIESGMENSLSYKVGATLYYLSNQSSAIHLLFGNLDISKFESVYGVTDMGFDSEYGSLIFRFGIVGFISVFIFWYLIFKRLDKYRRIFFFTLLWVISSTIVTSFRAFFIFMIFLSVIYSNRSALIGKK